MQVIPVAVDGNNGREVADFEFPNRLGAAELFQPNAEDALDALGVDLSGAADGVQIDAPVILAGFLSFGSHSAFANDSLHTEALDDVGLIRFFTNRGCWAGSDHTIAAAVLKNDGTAVINNAIANDIKIAAVVEILVNRITACEYDSTKKHNIADLQLSHGGLH